jgi:hypothetical protein
MAWVLPGWVVTGWVGLPPIIVPELPPTPDPAAVITLGTPGTAVHMTALGTVEALELMTPRPSSPVPLHYDTPLLIMALPQGWHVSGTRTIRDGIALLPTVAVCRTDLLDMGSISIRTAPLAANMIGLLSMGERPTVTITLSDADGYWSRLIGREGPALIGSNAGVYVDYYDAVVIPMLVGTVGRVKLGDGVIEIEVGDFTRKLAGQAAISPSVYVNLDDTMELRKASLYSKPADGDAILPRVYGDFYTRGLTVPVDDDDGGFIPAVSLNTDEWVYCIHDGLMPANIPPDVYVNKTRQVASVYEWHPNEDYQGTGVVISYIKFKINPGEAEISTRLVGQIGPNGFLIDNPMRAIQDCFQARGAFHTGDWDPTSCEQTSRDQRARGFTMHWVFNEAKTYREWLAELGMNYLFDFLPNAYGQLAVTQDRSVTTSPVPAIADIDAVFDCESTDTRGNTIGFEIDEANLINAIELEWQYDWTSQQYTETAPITFPPGITLNSWRARQFSLRALRTVVNAQAWSGSIFARYSFMPATVRFSVPHLRFLPAQPGTYLAFTWGAHAWDRRLLKVLNVEMDVMHQRMTWECLDCGRNASAPGGLSTPQLPTRRRRRTYRILPRFRGIPLIPLGLSLGTGAKQGPDGTTTSFVRATWVPVPQMHLTNYVVHCVLGGTNSVPIVMSVPIEQTEATFEGLPGLVVATVRVAAQGIDATSPFGVPQSILTAADGTGPSPPSGLVAVGGLRAFILAWNESPERDVLGYTVWASRTANIHEGTAVFSGFASRTAINATGHSVGTSFHFWVQAFDRSRNVSPWHPAETGPGVVATLDGVSASDLRELMAARTGSAEDNLLYNGGGEAGIEGQPAPYWDHMTNIKLTVHGGERKYGERCLLFNNTTAVDSFAWQYPQVFHNGIYEVSGWIASGIVNSGHPGLGMFIRVIGNTGVSAFHILEKRTYGPDPTPGQPSCGIVADDAAHGWTEVWCRFRITGDGTLAVGPQCGFGGGQPGFVMFDGLTFRRLHRQRTDDLEEGSTVKWFSAAGGTGSVSGEIIVAVVSITQIFQTGMCHVVGRANVTVPNGATVTVRVRQATVLGTEVASSVPFTNTTGGNVTGNLRATDLDFLPPWNGQYVATVTSIGGTTTVHSSGVAAAHHMRASS